MFLRPVDERPRGRGDQVTYRHRADPSSRVLAKDSSLGSQSNAFRVARGTIEVGSTDSSRKESAMRIIGILDQKGRTVHAVSPEARVTEAVDVLCEAAVGAVLVRDEDGKIRGILSERDIVRAFRTRGAKLADATVADIMTRNVTTCRPNDTVAGAMAVMTRGRFRHLPVMDGSQLVGLVSIGDLVKHRVREMELETGVLRDIVIAKR
nr:CBS domain-containing protein [Pseudonocardia saturnea]